jgi:hypothetical protein
MPIIAGDNSAETGVGASAWAYGSQICKRNAANFTPSPTTRANTIMESHGAGIFATLALTVA